MDTNTLTEALRGLDVTTFSWKFALYNTQKSKDGLELEWNLCKMRGIANQADRLREYLLKKPVADKPVAAYSPFLSDKEFIGALGQGDEIIRDQVSDILLNIKNGIVYSPEQFITGELPKTAGFAFYGEQADEDGKVMAQVLLMRRGNPFQTGSTSELFIGTGDEISICERPVLKFTSAVDFLLTGGTCYIFSSSVEKDLLLENRHFAIAEKRTNLIAESGIVSNYDKLEACVMKSKNARKFLDFDKSILEYIVRLAIPEREEFLLTYGVTLAPSGLMDTSDEEQCELIIDLLCCRSCLDPLGRLSVGNNITPRE